MICLLGLMALKWIKIVKNTVNAHKILVSYFIFLERNPPPPGWSGDRLRWRKEQMAYRPVTDVPDRQSHSQAESDAHIEGNLATEVSLVILDTLEQIVQV